MPLAASETIYNMVNIGGRSKGCSTCRKRRVKCGRLCGFASAGLCSSHTDSFKDETYPICLRCQRCGFECNGPRDITFVEGKIIKSRRSSNLPTGHGEQDTDFLVYQIPRFNLLGSNESEIYICHALKHLRRGGIIEVTTRNIKYTDIIPARATAHSGRISHHAILSFAIIFFGTLHRQAHIAQQGYVLYGVVLKRLNQALSDPTCNTDDDLIQSVVTLSIMELVAPTGPGNHLKHMAGLERLLNLRDHGTSISVESAALYRSLRQMILFAALRSRKASILAQPEWKKRLRTHCEPGEGLQRQDLFDVLADCSVLIAKRDHLLWSWELCPVKRVDRLDKIRQYALALLAQLSAWRKQWESNEENIYLETPIALAGLETTQAPCGDDAMPFGTGFEFRNKSSVIVLMLYNVALIYVLQILAFLDFDNLDNPPDQGFIAENFLNDPSHVDDMWNHTKNPHLLAQRIAVMEICRSIPYYIEMVSRLEPSAIAHWAITTIWLKLRGTKSILGNWVLDFLVQKSPVTAKTLTVLAS